MFCPLDYAVDEVRLSVEHLMAAKLCRYDFLKRLVGRRVDVDIQFRDVLECCCALWCRWNFCFGGR